MSAPVTPCAWEDHDWRFVRVTHLEQHEGAYAGLPPGRRLFYVEGLLRCATCGQPGQYGPPPQRPSCPCCGTPR